jgi:molecular chaperone GrpE
MTKQKYKDKEIEKDLPNQEIENEQIENTEDLTKEQEVENEIDKLNNDLEKEKNKFLRLFAEFENYKKRTSKERIELFSTASKELMTVLLPILDDFERGLIEIERNSDDVLLEGMQLIYNKFRNILSQKGLKEIEVNQGDIFDAEVHEAISQIPVSSKKLKGKIIEVVEKGYILGETIIRFPKVVLGN